MSQGDLTQFFGGGAFDPNSVEPAADFDVLPAGKYPVQIEKAEMKATKAGDGHYLELQFVVLDGPGKGRKLWDRLNIDNKNPTAVEIALRALSALCKATIGDVAFSNENQLLQQVCVASVKVGKDGTNGIRTYSKYADAQSVQSPAPPAPPAQIPDGATYTQHVAQQQQAPQAVPQQAPAPPAPPAPSAPSAPPAPPVQRPRFAPAPQGHNTNPLPAQQPQVPWAGSPQ